MKIIQFKRDIKSNSIRHKVDFIHIIISACEMINLNQFISLDNIDELEEDYPFILIENTSRMYLFENNKFFSISFPFQINIDKKQVSFLSVPLTLGLLSIVSSILNDFDERQSVVEITEKILDNEEYNALLKDEQQTVEELIVCLLSYETGYVRYDYDLENYEKYKSFGKPGLHPLNHLDINYTSNATYKIGIKNTIDIKAFLDCLDPNTDCWFFK